MTSSLPQLRIALLLGLASALATLALFPYVLVLQPGALAMASLASGLPEWGIVAAQSLQGGIVAFLLAWAGLKLGASLGLGAPWLAARLYGRARPAISHWRLAALLGSLAGSAILAAIALFGAPIAADPQQAPPSLAFAAKGLLASPYGAIVEEVGLRVFAMGLLAWLLSRFCAGQPRAWVMIAALLIAALLFGIGHLPMAAQLAPLTAALVARVVAYNALGGVFFGWIYWKHGLEHAMLAHFCADLVLHVIAPLGGMA